MAVVRKPYEVLLRWNADGTFANAQIAYLLTDSDGEMPPRIGDAEALTADSDPAFVTVLGQALADALAANAALQTQLQTLTQGQG